MISLYKCEKCGKVFTEYGECEVCESSHFIPQRYDFTNDMLDAGTHWKEGQAEPDIVHIAFQRWNSEIGNYETRYGKYRLISSYAEPTAITGD